jgi:L-fuculose-phosphate aldolase
MENIEALREQIIEGGQRLLREGLVARTWGNISIRVNDTDMLITPGGRSYEELTRDEIVLVNYHTSKYEGRVKPSSEKELHCEIYRTRKEVNSVIHTHQMNASTVAATHRTVPTILDEMIQIIGPTVRVAEYALPSTKKITRKTLQALKDRNAALMANHGAVCVGGNLDEAFVVCQVLEKACKAFIEAAFLGGTKSVQPFDTQLMHQYYLHKYSPVAGRNK